MTQSIILHPKVEALQLDLERLRQESSRLYLKAEYMQFEEKPMLFSLYETHIGTLLFEEFQIKVQIQLADYEARLIQAYINRNQQPDLETISEKIRFAQEKYKAELEEQEAAVKAAQDYLNAPTFSKEESIELRDLYRMIAKALHPDLHPNQTQREKDLFLKAVSAYRVGDIHVLRQIALALADETIKDVPEENLQSLIEQAKKSVEAFKERIDIMNKQFPFIYREKLRDENWIKEQQVELSERIATAKETIKNKQNYLMMLKLWKGSSLS